MRREGEPVWSADQRIGRLAGRQRGVVHRGQLRELGLTSAAIARRIATGRLHRILPNVFAVGHTALPSGGREAAALLWRGRHAVLSHESAAWVWGFSPGSSVVHVSGPPGGTASQPGTVVHRVRPFDRRDVRLRDGFRVTAPGRTLLDLAEVLPARELERCVGESRVARLVTDRELRDLIARSPGRHGVARLVALLDAEREPAFTRSEAERELLALLTRAGLPTPRTNVRVCGYEVDALWPEQRLVVEVDGYAFHRGRRAFERDRRKSAQLQAAGYRVLPATWRQLRESPEAVAAQISAAIVLGGR